MTLAAYREVMSDHVISRRLVSLAAGTMLDVSPEDGVEVAAAAGFGAVGLWFDPDRWTNAITAAVAERLNATGVVALDIEPVILGRGADHGERMIEVAAALAVPYLLVATGSAERPVVVERLATLSAEAATAAPGLRLVLEFLPIFSIATLNAALSVVADVDSPNVAVLIDSLHLARSGSGPADARVVRPELLPYLQLADAPAVPPGSLATMRDEALHGRLLPGEGGLPLVELLDAVPDVPVSIELRSRALQAAFPDPVERARAVLRSLRSLGLVGAADPR